jgi:hypothetical protein
MAEYIASLSPPVQSFLAAGFCVTALISLTCTGVLAVLVLDKISNRFVKQFASNELKTSLRL